MPHRRSINDRIARDGLRLAGAGIWLRYPERPGLGTVDDVRDAIPENEFQREHVVDGLKRRGWVVMVIPDMRKVEAGWPDVTAWHPSLPGLVLMYELKTSRGRVRPKQQRVIDHLRTVPGIDARIVRPADWPGILQELDEKLSRVVQ